MQREKAQLVMLLASVCLTACGGGGGSSDGAGTATALINGPTSAVIASDASQSMLDSGEVGDLVGSTPVGAAPPGAVFGKLVGAPNGSRNLLFDKIILPAMQAVSLDELVNCAVAGTLRLQAQLDTGLTLTRGDQISAIFTDCDEGNGEVIDGSFTMRVMNFGGDIETERFQLIVRMTLTDFSVTADGVVDSADGAVEVNLNTLDFPLTAITVSGVPGDSYTVTEGGVTRSLSNFATSVYADQSVFPVPYTIEASGELMSSRWDGMAVYSTPNAFAGVGADYPSSGQLLIEGADGATLTVTALDNVTVQIALDLDGMEPPESVFEIPWAELDD
jgi:hypothetical protein